MNTNSITQTTPQGQKSPRHTTCAYCANLAILYDGLAINPPMCPAHLDLSILVEYLQNRNLAVTIQNLQAQLARAQANGGDWTLTNDQVPELLPSFLAAIGA